MKELVSDSSKMDLLQDTAEPISRAGGASGKTQEKEKHHTRRGGGSKKSEK